MPAIFGIRMDQPYLSDGTTSSVRKLTEDLLKTRINEEAEEDEPFHGYGRRTSSERKSSIGGLSSNDSLWGDARRLSEAGVRRYSDNSVVLTEDTDSFIVGDRVWVGGTKPGRINYIGETKFAPGDWAGVVLDEPIGKNDGSVNGIRYFQCEPKKGVFSRLERLSRYPIGNATPPMAPSPSPPPSMSSPSGSVYHRRTTPPPVPRTPPLISPPSPAPSTRGEPGVGERVIVMSGQGSKIGVLRYRGETQFAAGIWCGVELDDPVGKNDGSVAGIRYFDCLPKYGLFAPASKVSKSPAPDRRASCQIHHTAAGVKRASSRESLSSVTSRASTVASTASRKPAPRPSTTVLGTPKVTPQELLRSKQEVIEKLLKERDLDRSRMVRAAEQTEETEKQLHHRQAEFDLFKAESQKKFEELEEEIKKLNQEKSDLQTQLEDWKFRADEEAITKSTLEEEQEEQLQCIDAWKKALAEKEDEVRNLNQQLANLKIENEEIEQLKGLLETSSSKSALTISELKQELIDTIDRANRMEQNYNDVQHEFESQISSKDELALFKNKIKDLEELLSKSEKKYKEFEISSKNSQDSLQTEKTTSEELKQTISLLENQLKEARENIAVLSDEAKYLKNKIEEFSQLPAKVNQLQEELIESQNNYQDVFSQKEILEKKLAESQSSKDQLQEDFEKLQESINDWKKTTLEKQEEMKNLHNQISELNETKKLMSLLKEENEAFKEKSAEIENVLKKELLETVEKAKKVEEKYKEIQNQIDSIQNERLAEVSSLKSTITKLEDSLSESEKYRADFEESQRKIGEHAKTIENLEKNNHELEFKLKEAETFNKLLGEGEQKLKDQCAEMSNVLTQVAQLRVELTDSHNKYKTALEQNESLMRDLNEIQASSNNRIVDIDKKYTNDIENLKRKLEEFSSELLTKEKELNEGKIKADEHEKEYSSLQKELADLRNSLQSNQNSINTKETEICLLKQNLDITKGELQKSLDELEQSKNNLSIKIRELEEEAATKKSQMTQLEAEKIDLLTFNENEKKQLTEKIALLEKTVQDLQCDLEAGKNDAVVKNNQLTSQDNKFKELDDICRKQANELESQKLAVKDLESRIEENNKIKKENQSNMNVLEAQLKVFASEKDLLEDKCKQLSKEVSMLKANQNSTGGQTQNPDIAALVEEQQLATSEINFLHSIIADLKNKNDDLNHQIEAQSSVIGESSADILNGNKKKKKAATPRMFCDICDVFDAHETEDCPVQASSDSPPPRRNYEAKPSAPRPYCDICEVFGHDTEDCDDTQTF